MLYSFNFTLGNTESTDGWKKLRKKREKTKEIIIRVIWWITWQSVVKQGCQQYENKSAATLSYDVRNAWVCLGSYSTFWSLYFPYMNGKSFQRTNCSTGSYSTIWSLYFLSWMERVFKEPTTQQAVCTILKVFLLSQRRWSDNSEQDIWQQWTRYLTCIEWNIWQQWTR